MSGAHDSKAVPNCRVWSPDLVHRRRRADSGHLRHAMPYHKQIGVAGPISKGWENVERKRKKKRGKGREGEIERQHGWLGVAFPQPQRNDVACSSLAHLTRPVYNLGRAQDHLILVQCSGVGVGNDDIPLGKH